MPEAGSQIAFRVRLIDADWEPTIGGWRCDALKVPGSEVESLYLDGRRIDKIKYEVLSDQSLIRWSTGKMPERVVAAIKLTKELSLGSDTERWKKLAIVLPFVATILASIVSSAATYFAAFYKNQPSVAESAGSTWSPFLDFAEYQVETDKRVKNNQYPRVVEAKLQQGVVKYRAIYEPRPDPNFQFLSHHADTDEGFAKTDADEQRAGFMLISRQRIVVGSQSFNQATWTKPSP
jgi:hypothetical protein